MRDQGVWGFRIDREVYWARMHGKLLQLSSMLECDPNPSWSPALHI
jgi:hypothetical protein|eukprot:COSAG01_NODE_561_length_15460_cov_95.444307_15_plen_46_part_00